MEPYVAQRPLKPASVHNLTVFAARALSPTSVGVAKLSGSGSGPTGTSAMEPAVAAALVGSTGVAEVKALRATRMM